MITLYNVIDTRTGNFYSVARVKQRNAKWFIPAPVEEEPEVENENEEVE